MRLTSNNAPDVRDPIATVIAPPATEKAAFHTGNCRLGNYLTG